LDEGRRYVFQKLLESGSKDKIYQVEDGELKFHKAGVDEYEGWLKKFKLLMCVLIMLTCGQTGRGTEMTSLLYMNTINSLRGIYILDGQVMIVTKYHKSMSMTDMLKV
jgi:hypothetical protein